MGADEIGHNLGHRLRRLAGVQGGLQTGNRRTNFIHDTRLGGASELHQGGVGIDLPLYLVDEPVFFERLKLR